MEFGSEFSALEFAEENGEINSERMADVVGNKIDSNGSCGGEYGDDKLSADKKINLVEVTESLSSPSLIGKSPEPSLGSSPATKTKGFGLKKWKRIKREVNRDGSSSVNIIKITKRRVPTSMVNSSKNHGLSVEMNQKRETSLSSTNAILKTPTVSADGFALQCSGLDSKLATVPIFPAGTDSENSEDWSSRSSTAISVAKLKYEIPVVEGHASDRNRMRNLSGKNMMNSAQKGQLGRGRIESSKKPRGEQVKIEKENSHSSMESDSQSSNIFFVQGTNSVTSNGRQSGGSMNYDGENSDEAPGGEESLIGDCKETLGEFEDLSEEDLAAEFSWESKEGKVENHRSSSCRDPLVESVLKLQSAQEELETELQKLREIGNEYTSLFDGSANGSNLPPEVASADPKVHDTSSSDLLQSREAARTSSCFLETQVSNLEQNISLLESKVEEANAVLKVKEAKVIELNCALKNQDSVKEETWSSTKFQKTKYSELEAELEDLFQQKIEAEVEYLVLRTLASGQAQMLNKLGYAKSKSAAVQKRAEKLVNNYEDIVGTDQILKLQRRVFNVSSYFFMQLILLAVVFASFVLQLSPHDEGVVPT